MSTTSVPRGNALANKQFSTALSAMAVRAPTPINALTGPMPTHDAAMRKLKQQTTTEMPIVRVDDLSKAAGDVVQVDCAHVVKLRPVMGDKNAEGLGAALKYSTKDITLDMATLPVSAGGKMTQQRTPHSMRLNALAQLKRGIPSFRWQRCLTLLAGARGFQDGTDWILPLASDPEFADMLVNTVKAPTYNRHWVVNGTSLTQGGLQAASIATTDKMLLSHIDEMAAIWDEMTIKMAPIQIPGDPAAGDDPIKGILLVDPLVWDTLVTDTTSGSNIRTFEQNAIQRARYGDLSKHPLFSGSPIMWNGILMRKMQYGIRFNASDAYNYVAVANRLTATETAGTVAAGLSTTHQMARSVFLSAQALAMVSGANQTSEETYSLLEAKSNFDRNLELAGEIMGTEDKLRWALPNASGDLEVTDFGVAVIDSVVRKRSV
ncbi:hypothetical protein D9M73_75510 [compost metagenome]|nr:MAG TPA: major capsid protein [Caudoviricetes sp.]